MSRLICPFLVLLLVLNFHSALKLKFDISRTLINFSDYNMNLPFFVLNLMRNEEFWPVLLEFNNARYFDFSSVLVTVINRRNNCTEIVEILSNPNFPLKHLISAQVLVEASVCTARLTVETLQRAHNPLESSKFYPAPWMHEQLELFLRNAHYKVDDNNPIDWNNACATMDGFDRFIDSGEDFSFLYNYINYKCVKMISSSSKSNFLRLFSNQLDQIRSSLSLIELPRRFSLIPSSLARLFTRPSLYEISLTIKQIMTSVSLIAISLTFRQEFPFILETVREIANDLLMSLSKRLRIVKKLNLVLNAFLSPNRLIDDFGKISSAMLKLIQFCREKARAPWLYNVLIFWNHLRGIYCSLELDLFLMPFFELFFAPESRASSSDICALLKFVVRNFPDTFLTREIMIKYLPKLSNSKIIESVFVEIFERFRIPSHLISYKALFPLEGRFSFIFKQLRRIEAFYSPSVEIDYDSFLPTEDWIPIISTFNVLLDLRLPTIPLNSQLSFQGDSFGMRTILQKIFLSILNRSKWWIVLHKMASIDDPRPILVPSLLLPPQIIEIFGFVLASAVSINLHIPFLIDWEYFCLVDMGLGITLSSKLVLLNRMYPRKRDDCFLQNIQIARIHLLIDSSRRDILSAVRPGTFWLNWSVHGTQCASSSDKTLYRILLTGSSSLRAGLSNSLPISAVSTKNLYNLIFSA